MSPSRQRKSSTSSITIPKIFGYRRCSMSSQHAPAQQYVPPPPAPVEQKRTASNNGSTTMSASSSRSSMNLEPAPHVAEWCHQMHMIQNRRYDWCHGCHPRVVIAPAEVPSERVREQHQARREATHAYQ